MQLCLAESDAIAGVGVVAAREGCEGGTHNSERGRGANAVEAPVPVSGAQAYGGRAAKRLGS